MTHLRINPRSYLCDLGTPVIRAHNFNRIFQLPGLAKLHTRITLGTTPYAVLIQFHFPMTSTVLLETCRGSQ